VGDEAIQQIAFPLLADTVVSEVARSPVDAERHSQFAFGKRELLLQSGWGNKRRQRIVAVP